ncbi:2-oxo acid dehydrogenase subunit E2 [bacterium]|nr:2-oxo acid dehydrogenase subunit E2 [bacterium]
MAVEVTMPKFGLTMHEGTIQRFFKHPGEPVAAGEPLYEVETEKVLYVVEAPAAGTLAAWLYPEGAVVACGLVVALIAAPGEDVSAIAARAGDGAPAARAAQESAANGGAERSAAATADQAAATGARRAITPIARKRAAELGVNLDLVAGSGPGGRVTREDVERAAATKGAEPPAAPAAPSAFPGKPTVRMLPLTAMRRTIAQRMHASLSASAQLTITTEADVSAAVELRERLKPQFDFTYTDLLIHAVARALIRHPRMNARFGEGAILLNDEVNIGLAVALDEGLIVPVIAGANRMTLKEIAARTRELGERARAGKLTLEEVGGGTFTITNLGNYGIDAFTPILNIGETGILGVSRIVEKPAVWRGEITRRSMMTLSLTFDHRAIDGAPAAAFLQTVIEIFNYGER